MSGFLFLCSQLPTFGSLGGVVVEPQAVHMESKTVDLVPGTTGLPVDLSRGAVQIVLRMVRGRNNFNDINVGKKTREIRLPTHRN